MEITKTLKITYPTVTYHGADVFTAVKVTDSDLPPEMAGGHPSQKFQQLNQLADMYLAQSFLSQYYSIQNEIRAKYSDTLYRILDNQLELQLIKDGRIRTDGQGKIK